MNNINSLFNNDSGYNTNSETPRTIIEKDKSYTLKDNKLKNHIWGLGLEHETQLFHWYNGNPESNQKYFIIYNTLDISVDIVESNFHTSYDSKFIENIPFEPTGRKCHGKWVLKKTPISMPEFITSNPFSSIKLGKKGIYNFYKELIDNEFRFLSLIKFDKKNNYLKKQIMKYGVLTQYPYGMSSYIRLPKNYFTTNYKFYKGLIEDYLGSFHVTMTLPFKSKKSYSKQDQTKFIEMHKNFANQFQWLEPLLLSAFFHVIKKL